MASKQALRDLQARLSGRLQAVRDQQRQISWLAVECGGQGFLLPLAEAGEIFPAARIAPVAHARPWFLGVANLRGGLYGVVDLAAFVGLRPRGAEPARAQFVALGAALQVNCALRVDRLAGLRSQGQLEAEPSAAGRRPSFVGGRFKDAAGRVWQELRLAELARHPAFLRIVN